MNRIKLLREEKGWSQAKLGNALNVKTAAVSKYENGNVSLAEEILKKLSSVFSCSIDYILCNDNAFEDSVFNGEEIKLISDYRKLDVPQQKILLSMVAFLRSPQAKGLGSIIQTNSGDNSFLAVGNNNSYSK